MAKRSLEKLADKIIQLTPEEGQQLGLIIRAKLLPEMVYNNYSGCSVARLSRHVWDVEVAGSNPATPTKYIRAISSVGSEHLVYTEGVGSSNLSLPTKRKKI